MSTNKNKKTKNEKNPENFSMKNAISHANKLLAGFDNTSFQIQKATEAMKLKVEKLEEHNRDLRATLSGITNAAENAVQDAKLARTQVKASAPPAPTKTKAAPAAKPVKAAPAARPAKANTPKPAKANAVTTANRMPIRELVQQFITKNGPSSAKDIFHYVTSQQPASRAAVYQMLKKSFTKKGEGMDAIYSVDGNVAKPSVTEDDTENFIQKQSAKMERDLNVS